MIYKLLKIIKNFLFGTKKETIYNEEKQLQIFKDDIISNSSFGDIIWAKRYDFDWEKDNIPTNHDIGPYIVLDKTDDKLICMYCTSVEKKNNFFEIDEEHKLFDKPTFTTISKIKTIDYYSFVKKHNFKHSKLSQRDRDTILKKLNAAKNVVYDDSGLLKPLNIDTSNITPSVGDVLKNNTGYGYRLIIDIKNNIIKTIILQTYDTLRNRINFAHENLQFNTSTKEIDIKNYVGTLSKKDLSIILKKYQEIINHRIQKNEFKENFILKRGIVLNKNDNYYYVYNIDRNNAQIFPIIPELTEKENSIKIESLFFYPIFEEQYQISLNDKTYSIVGLATSYQIDEISEKRKSYLKLQKIKLKETKKSLLKQERKELVVQTNIKNFTKGSILKSNYYFGMSFIVLGISNDKIITILLDDFLNRKIIYYEFNINDSELSNKEHTEEERQIINENEKYLEELFNNYQIDKKNNLSKK